jgi:uncharacterized protein (DUF1697 family)
VATRVAFLRAVNVGRRTVRMPALVDLTSSLGHEDVWTHINSGNVVFDGAGARGALERGFERALEAELGFEVTTFIRSAGELEKALAVEPFDLASGDTYFITFLKDRLSKGDASALEDLSNDFDTLVADGRDVHWRMRGKSTDTKIPSKAWAGVVGKNRSTSRNTTMLRKLVDKIDSRR